MDPGTVRSAILADLPDAEVAVDGDGRRYSVRVVSEQFLGKSLVQQHQLVYQSLGDKVGADIHALSIQTFTPRQWQARKDLQ